MGILETISKVNITEDMWEVALENHNVEFVRRCFPSYEIIQKYWNGHSHFD